MRAPSPNHWTPGNSLHQAFCRTYPVEHASSRNLLLQVLFLAWHINYYRFQCLLQQPEEFQSHSFGFSLKNSLKGLIPIVRQHLPLLGLLCGWEVSPILIFFSLTGKHLLELRPTFSLQLPLSWLKRFWHLDWKLFHISPLYPLIIRLWPIAGRALEWWEPWRKYAVLVATDSHGALNLLYSLKLTPLVFIPP